jgi:hypothetical protein
LGGSNIPTLKMLKNMINKINKEKRRSMNAAAFNERSGVQ